MDTLRLLSVALGLAALAGVNLYLTVFVTGLAIQQNWIHLAPQFYSLEILAHPAIIAISGALYFIEFLADKVPWVDSLWDAIHTVVRPIGGALLALRVLGKTDPSIDIIVALLAGGTSLLTHSAKAGTRLVANASPEPFSNIALSVAEDIAVLGGLALISFNPLLALLIVGLIVGVIAWFGPRIVRTLRTTLWLIWRKLKAPAAGEDDASLKSEPPAKFARLFEKLNLLHEKILWAAPCVSRGDGRIPANIFGCLIGTIEEPRRVYFVGGKGWRSVAETIGLENFTARHESKFLSENLVLAGANKSEKHVFVFDRTQAARVGKLAESINERLHESPLATLLVS
ncbi:MAG: DUF4126 domain-containing protein [Verrucomicrobiota bacterium]|nr:DUF4126 domain-containing protein [Verrucomicrobiota bacterium]